jgi:hypothetical protein
MVVIIIVPRLCPYISVSYMVGAFVAGVMWRLGGAVFVARDGGQGMTYPYIILSQNNNNAPHTLNMTVTI